MKSALHNHKRKIILLFSFGLYIILYNLSAILASFFSGNIAQYKYHIALNGILCKVVLPASNSAIHFSLAFLIIKFLPAMLLLLKKKYRENLVNYFILCTLINFYLLDGFSIFCFAISKYNPLDFLLYTSCTVPLFVSSLIFFKNLYILPAFSFLLGIFCVYKFTPALQIQKRNFYIFSFLGIVLTIVWLEILRLIVEG